MLIISIIHKYLFYNDPQIPVATGAYKCLISSPSKTIPRRLQFNMNA